MKYLKLFFLSTLLISFISCSDDDETPQIDSDSLLGTWTMISLDADTDLDGNFSIIDIESSTNTVGENFDYDLTFTETGYTVEGSYDLVTTGTTNGQPINDTTSITDVSESGTYTLDGNTITVDGDLYEYDINEVDLSGVLTDQSAKVSLNSNGQLVIDQIIDQNVNEEGIMFTVKIDATTIWRKK
ncbi:hypothetical protein LV716_00535 [Flagellimonas sp. HMM57]|uniref:hypothetical protein n=1 Tax=unclassified Flagellimonas TaxID=2644544 RepID=UPI0013D3B85B|nr:MULTISPECIES: hypothetical protein [unclassified Flagellimonas]UII76313.1 hypothetical protein LV716_00535 [Flagellimonas sp. HMM57]